MTELKRAGSSVPQATWGVVVVEQLPLYTIMPDNKGLIQVVYTIQLRSEQTISVYVIRYKTNFGP